MGTKSTKNTEKKRTRHSCKSNKESRALRETEFRPAQRGHGPPRGPRQHPSVEPGFWREADIFLDFVSFLEATRARKQMLSTKQDSRNIPCSPFQVPGTSVLPPPGNMGFSTGEHPWPHTSPARESLKLPVKTRVLGSTPRFQGMGLDRQSGRVHRHRPDTEKESVRL